MSIKTKFEKINLDKLKSDSPQAYNILNGWATSTKNFSDDKANEVIEPLFNKLYDKLVSGKFWYVIEGNKQPSDQVAEPITKKEEVAIVKEVIKSEPTPKKKDEPKTKSVKAKATKTHTASTKPKHTPTPPKMDGKSVFEIAKELRAKDSTLTQKEAVKKAGQLVKDAHKKVKDDELQALMKMIKSDPAYSVLKPEKNTSIIRDLGRPAIRTTKRVSKKGWKNQYGASEGGRTYYENRVNRMDVNKTPMYAKGGSVGFKKRSEMDSLKIAKAYNKLVESNFSDKEYEIYQKVVKDTRIPRAELQKIEFYLSTTPKGKQRMIDIYQYWGVNEYAKGGSVDDEGNYSYRDFYRGQGGIKFDTEQDAMNFIKGSKPFLRKAFTNGELVIAFDGEQFYIAEKVKYAKGGSVRGKHLPTSEVEYARKLKIDKLVINGKEVSEDDIVSGVFFKKFAKGGKVVGDYSVLAYKTKDDYEGDTDEKYFGMSNRSLEYVIDEFDSRVDSGLFYGYKITKGGNFSNVIYQSSGDGKFAKGGSVVGDYSVIAYKTKYDYENDTDETYSGMSNRSLDYVIDEFDSRIDSGLIYGYKVTKSGDFANVIYEISRDSKGGVSKRLEKTGRDYSVLGYKTKADFNDLDDAVYSGVTDRSLENTKNLFDEKIKSGMWYGYQIFESGDMRNPIYTNTKDGEFAKGGKVYNREWHQDHYRVNKREKHENQSNMRHGKVARNRYEDGGVAGYFYVPKSEIVSIDYTKDGESHTIKNTDILDGAYVKISALKYASGGRLPKDEVVYVPKAEIDEIMVSDSGFKVKDVTDELLSGIHLKASALSPKSAPKKPSGTFGQTRIYKSYGGVWIGKTSVSDVDGKDYEITTMKRSNGKLWSNAQSGKSERGMFSYMLYQDPNLNLIETKPSKVTQKAVSEQHDKAIAKFKEMKGL